MSVISVPTQKYLHGIRDPEVLHLNFSDAFGPQVYFDSTYRHVPEPIGSPTVTTNNHYEGNASLYIDNSLNIVQCAGEHPARSTDFIFEGDFSISFYVFLQTNSAVFIANVPSAISNSTYGTYTAMTYYRSDKFIIGLGTNRSLRVTIGGTKFKLEGGQIPINNWTKVELNRYNSTVKLLLNDIVIDSVENDTNTWGWDRLFIGQNSNSFIGYIDRLVVTNHFNPQLGRWFGEDTTFNGLYNSGNPVIPIDEDGRLYTQPNPAGWTNRIVDRPKNSGKWFCAMEIVHISGYQLPLAVGVVPHWDNLPTYNKDGSGSPLYSAHSTLLLRFTGSYSGISFPSVSYAQKITPNLSASQLHSPDDPGYLASIKPVSALSNISTVPKLVNGSIVGFAYNAENGKVLAYYYQNGKWIAGGLLYQYPPNTKLLPYVVTGGATSSITGFNQIRLRSDLGTPIGYSMWV